MRRDTCRIAAISLNMQEKVHPVIWSLDNLPFDCQKALAVPKPNGKIRLFFSADISDMFYISVEICKESVVSCCKRT